MHASADPLRARAIGFRIAFVVSSAAAYRCDLAWEDTRIPTGPMVATIDVEQGHPSHPASVRAFSCCPGPCGAPTTSHEVWVA